MTAREIQEIEQEYDAQMVLYGPQTRSGEVTSAPLAYEVYDPLARQGWIRPWMDWDSIDWFPVGRSISVVLFSSEIR